MAAPTLSKGETKLTLGAKVKQKQKKDIKKHKTVLLNPFPYKWPKLDTYFECRILDELQALLKSLPIKLPKRPASYFKNRGKESRKNKQTSGSRKQSSANGGSCQTPDKEVDGDETNEVKQPSTDDSRQMTDDNATGKKQMTSAEMQDKRVKEMRSRMVCGVRCVTKGLERDDLDVIIVCRSTNPSIITSHLIPLAASRGCPALSVPNFNKTIAPLLGVSSLVVLGFKKVPDGIQSEFAEFVRYSRSVSLPLDAPLTNQALGMPPVQDTTQTLNDNDDKSADTSGTDNESESAVPMEVSSPVKKSFKDSSGFVSLDASAGNNNGDVQQALQVAGNSTDTSTGQSECRPECGVILDKTLLGGKSAKDSGGFLSLDTACASNRGDSVPNIKSPKSKVKELSGFLSLNTSGDSPQAVNVSDKSGDATANEDLESGDGRDDMESRDLSGGSENKSDSGATSASVEQSGFLSLDTPTAKNCDDSGSVVMSLTTSTSIKHKANPVSVSQISPAHKTMNSKHRGTSLEFPLNGPPPFVPKDDYSHLYVFKIAGKFGDDFVPFGGAKSNKRPLVMEEVWSEPEQGNALGMEDLPDAKRSKQTRSVRNVEGYIPAVIKRQIPNANKKQKRKK